MFLPNMDCVTCCRPHMTFPHSGLSDVANPAVAVVVYIDELNAVFRLRKAKKIPWQNKILALSESEVQNVECT